MNQSFLSRGGRGVSGQTMVETPAFNLVFAHESRKSMHQCWIYCMHIRLNIE